MQCCLFPRLALFLQAPTVPGFRVPHPLVELGVGGFVASVRLRVLEVCIRRKFCIMYDMSVFLWLATIQLKSFQRFVYEYQEDCIVEFFASSFPSPYLWSNCCAHQDFQSSAAHARTSLQAYLHARIQAQTFSSIHGGAYIYIYDVSYADLYVGMYVCIYVCMYICMNE